MAKWETAKCETVKWEDTAAERSVREAPPEAKPDI